MVKKILRKLVYVSAISCTLSLLTQCTPKVTTDLVKNTIIPKPVSVTATGGSFSIREGTVICLQNDSGEVRQIGQYLADILRPATGYELNMKAVTDSPKRNAIVLSVGATEGLQGKEAYQITVTSKLLTIRAVEPEGLFRGIQTLRQLLPAAIELKSKQEGPWEIPTGTITDYPVYSYRGAMLDVSRHFFGVADVKRYIDHLAYYKFNFLHLHLSDDQGWRIEIKAWPELALHGGSTQVGGGKGGFYTQEEYSDLVKYAAGRYITIVPEIDMPGHTNAALASVADLNCNRKATELYTGTEVGFSSFCTKSEFTYKFIDDVIKELSALTPGAYMHIGGDESHATKKEDYIPFINRVQDIVLSHGKQVMGWDDIAIAAIKPGTVAQHWATVSNAKIAVEKGAKLLMSPATKAYIDMQYDKNTPLGLHWAAYIEADSAYMWDPASMIPGIGSENIIGVEAPLWTETITNIDQIEFMAFPRLPGYAEIGWTPANARNWEEYRLRIGKHGERFKALGIDFYASPKISWE